MSLFENFIISGLDLENKGNYMIFKKKSRYNILRY